MGTVNYKGSEIRAASKLGLAGVDIAGWAEVHANPNRIIDPCFLHWPEGTARSITANGQYGPALFQVGSVNPTWANIVRSTDIPGGSKVPYSLHWDVQTADTSIAAGDFYLLKYFVTGYDLASLWNKTVALTFWVKSARTGTFCISFANDDTSRSFVREYTINTANTWEQKTITVTLNEATGTWLFDSGAGLEIQWAIAMGSTFQGVADTWNSANDVSTANQVNGMTADDNITPNDFLIHAPQLNIGSVALPFTAPAAAEIEKQVSWYARRRNLDSTAPQRFALGLCKSPPTSADFPVYFTPMRTKPTITLSAKSTWAVTGSLVTDIAPATAVSAGNIGEDSFRFIATHNANIGAAFEAAQLSSKTTGAWMLFDARH